ncbi:hypothetical protein ACFW1A_04945 [Kitasatospora sp. NPDC058965]|uniref:hypothetical protein n=1 Tax=Kitasatospora sp. NPDC058965 TaxID=3346682 RepID=UPI0036C730B6
MTRGTPKRLDYAFLGARPASQWWEGPQNQLPLLVFTDEAGVCVSGTGDDWSATLFEVPSARRDVDGRAIRYTLVVEAGPGEAPLAAGLVRLALDTGARVGLGAALDRSCTAELVDGVLGESTPPQALPLDELTELVRKTAEQLAGDPVEPQVPLPWAAPAGDPAAVAELAARARRLAEGGEGRCFLAQGIRSRDEADRLTDRFGPEVAVLLAEADFTGTHRLRSAGPRESAPAGAEEGHTPGRVGTLLRAVRQHPVTSAGCGLIVVLLLIWLVRRP